MLTELPLPAWLREADGRLVPFDPDRICRSLFAAGERLGRPDAFLARELTDAVLHFIAAEGEPSPTRQDIHDLVIKVVRELGHPHLAHSFATAGVPENHVEAAHSLIEDVEACLSDKPGPLTLSQRVARLGLRTFSLNRVFPPELVAAHRDGFLTLIGVETPLELAATVVGAPVRPRTPGQGMLEAVSVARRIAGQSLAVDGPEWTLAPLAANGADEDELAAEWTRELRTAVRAAGVICTVNLNTVEPPIWATRSVGPLFADSNSASSATPNGLAERLLHHILADRSNDDDCADSEPHSIRIAWHTAAGNGSKPGTLAAIRRTLAGEPIEFCFDRPRRPVSLAEGLDRQQSAVLMAVGVHVDRVADVANVDVFLQKLASLARLAKSVGRIRLSYLRQHARSAVQRGFLLERAHLLIIPRGLAAAVRRWTGRSVHEEAGQALAVRVLQVLRQTLERDPPRSLVACMDADLLDDSQSEMIFPIRQQIRTLAPLHAAAGGGTLVVHLPVGPAITPIEASAALRIASQTPEVSRVRFSRTANAEVQRSF